MPETRDEHIDAGRTTADAAHEPEPPNGGSAAELLVAAMFEAGPQTAEHLLKAARELLLAANAVIDAGERAVEAGRAAAQSASEDRRGAGASAGRSRVRRVELA